MLSDNSRFSGGPQPPGVATPHRPDIENFGAEATAFGEGRFQLRVLISVVVAGTISLIQSNIFRLLTREMDHWCRRPPSFSEFSVETWKELAIPRDPDGKYSRCTMREPPNGGPSAQAVPCSEWEFNLSEFGNNVVSEWSLVCGRSYLKDISSLVNFVSAVMALPVMGAAADRIGRKTVTILQLVPLLLTLAGSALALDFGTFAASQAVVAAASRSVFVLYVLLYEVTTLSRRLLYCITAPAFSTMFVPVFVFLVDTFKLSWYWSLIIVAALSSVLIVTFYVLEESPVWLLETHNTEQAELVVMKAASVNALSPSKSRELFRKYLSGMEQNQHEPARKHAVSWIFAPELRNRSALLAFIWLVMASARGHYTEERGIPVSSYVRIGASLGLIPMFLAVWPFLQAGRFVKRVVAISLLVCAAACAALFAIFSGELSFMGSVLMVIVRLSINLAVAISIYLTVSLYPPRARCLGLGTCYAFSVVGNIGDFYIFSNALVNREDIALGTTAFLLALASVAVENLPSSAPCSYETRMPCSETPIMKHSVRQLDISRQQMLPSPVVRSEIRSLVNNEKRRLAKQAAPTQRLLRARN